MPNKKTISRTKPHLPLENGLAIKSVELLRPQAGDVVMIALNFAPCGGNKEQEERLTVQTREFFLRALPSDVKVVVHDGNLLRVKVIRKGDMPS